jgi:hypothetical protein
MESDLAGQGRAYILGTKKTKVAQSVGVDQQNHFIVCEQTYINYSIILLKFF